MPSNAFKVTTCEFFLRGADIVEHRPVGETATGIACRRASGMAERRDWLVRYHLVREPELWPSFCSTAVTVQQLYVWSRTRLRTGCLARAKLGERGRHPGRHPAAWPVVDVRVAEEPPRSPGQPTSPRSLDPVWL